MRHEAGYESLITDEFIISLFQIFTNLSQRFHFQNGGTHCPFSIFEIIWCFSVIVLTDLAYPQSRIMELGFKGHVSES